MVYSNILAAIKDNFQSDSMEASRGNASSHPQVVSFEELPISQVVRQEALTGLVSPSGRVETPRLQGEEGFSCREGDIHEGRVFEKGKRVDQEMKGKKGII